MGSSPSEYYGETCVTCDKQLPGCKSWDDLESTIIDGRWTYVYNNGQYYRWKGWDNHYQCRYCFFKPIKDREEAERKRKEEEERKRKEEEEKKRKEEEERRRKKEEERERKEEEERKRKELEENKKLSNENAEKLQKETDSWHNKNVNKVINEDMQQKTTNKFNQKFWEEENDESTKNIDDNGFSSFYYLFYNLHGYELDYLDLNDMTPEDVSDLIDPMLEFIQNDWLGTSPPHKDLVTTVQLFSLTVFRANLKLMQAENIVIKNSIELLVLKITESAQTLNEIIYFTICLLSTVTGGNDSKTLDENPLGSLCLSLAEKNKDLEGKADTLLINLIENLLLSSLRIIPKSQGNSVIQKISSLLVERVVVDFEYDDCSLKDSFIELVRNEKWDAKSIWILLRGILVQCTSIKEEIVHYCQAFHVISTYCIGPNQIINGKESLLQLATSVKAEILAKEVIEFANKTKDAIKDLDQLLEEIHETNLVDSETLESVRSTISDTKTKLQRYGYPGKANEEIIRLFSDPMTEIENWIKQAETTQGNIDEDSLAKSITYLSCAVNKINGWWPRDTQLISCCILMISNKSGRLLEMNTGEGKSCVVAMFAAWLACRGKFVDIITSSPILAQRDAQEWIEFYKLFNLKVSNNVNKKDDDERKSCYEANIVYGTVANFASDILRQEFHMKDIRPSRRFDSIIADEVDSMLLDQGIQLTYLSHDMPGLQHLNPVLSMVWCSVSQFTPLHWETGVMWCAPPQPFFKAMYDAIDPTACEVSEPLQLLLMGETHGIIPEGFTENYEKAPDKNTKENEEAESKQELLAQISLETIINFYTNAEEYLPCNFILYTLDEENNIMKIDKPYIGQATERVDVSILIAGTGVCCILTHSEDEMRGSIEDRIKDLVLQPEGDSKPDDLMANLPKFLRPLIENQLTTWVENAFYAMQMQKGREYLVKNDKILPIDFRSTGIIQLNKKWSNGLHQFLQMKHKLQLDPLSVVTNFLSNIAFFKRYGQSLYGMTGTLGSQIDHDFLTSSFGVKLCDIPTFSAKKLFEYEGILASNRIAWENSIVESLKEKITPKSWRGNGRAALIICEDINTAREIFKLVSEQVSTNVKLYIRNDTDQLNVIHHKLVPQEVIVATNLAGRGTNVKVLGDVKDSGGLFVLVTFLPQNARVERQAFGRTARKGDPGSCQIIANTETLPEHLREAQSIANVSHLRDELARRSSLQADIQDVMLKEKLFEQYCSQLKFFQDLNLNCEQKKNYVTTLNEFWGMWQLNNSNKFEDTPESDLIDLLREEVNAAIKIIYKNESATQNIYPLIRFGNEILLYPDDQHFYSAYELFSRAIAIDPDWSLIAYYNRAYCRILEASNDYINLSIADLKKAMESLKKHKEEYLITLQLVNTARSLVEDKTGNEEENSLTKQYNIKFQIFNFFEKNIQEALDNLDKYKADDVEAVEKSVFSLITDSDPQIHAELYIMWQSGLINVYSVKKKPRFCWEALVVFLLGALQVIAGIALTVLSAGTLSNIGMGLIGEGVSDMIDGVIGMATGEFSWEEWGISKAIGIATSLIGFGIGKIISKGFKGFKLAAKSLTKELKALPKMARTQMTGGLTQVTKENFKNAAKYAGKELAEEGILRGLQFAEDKIMDEFMDLVKETIKPSVKESLRSSIYSGELGAAMDQLVLQKIGGVENAILLSEKDGPKERLEKTIVKFGSKVLESHMEDLSWQNQLNRALQGTMEKVKNQVAKEGKLKKYKVLFEVADAVHMGALAVDAAQSVKSLIKVFSKEYTESIEQFITDSGSNSYDLDFPIVSNEHFNTLKEDILNSLTELLSKGIVTIVNQKFTSHIVSKGEKLLNGKITKYTGDKFLKGNEIEDKLKAGQASLAISSMSADSDLSLSSRLSYKYADEIKDSSKAGSILDLRILSEKLGVKINILEPLDNNKFRKMVNINPDSANKQSQTLQLIYRVASAEYPDGHYDVLKDGKILEVDNENKNCAFHALSKALHPDNTEEENRKKANDLRELEGEELFRNSEKWNYFVRMKNQVQDLTNALWYLGIGGAKTQKRKLLDGPANDKKLEVQKVQKKYHEDVQTNLKLNFQKNARDRWDSIVNEKKTNGKGESKYTEIELKYKDNAGKDLTNKDILETLAFYHEKGNKGANGKLKPLDIEMNIGGTKHHFKMRQAPQGQKQILIDTLNSDFENTKATNSYESISKELDSVEGRPSKSDTDSDKDFDKKNSEYENKKKEIIQTRAKMISEAINGSDTDQPNFNEKYTLDGKQYPIFNDQQKRAAVSLIAITQIAESCPPDDKFRIMLQENSKKTTAKYDADMKVSKDALKILSQYPGKPTRKKGENDAQWKTRNDAYEKLRDEAIAERVKIFKDAITNNKTPDFKEKFKSSDGKDYDCFSPEEREAAELYIEISKINEYYHKDSDTTKRRDVNALLEDIKKDLDPKVKKKKAISVTKTGRVPGTDIFAMRLLDLIKNSDLDFATMFARDFGSSVTWIPIYPPVPSTEYGRYLFNKNR